MSHPSVRRIAWMSWRKFCESLWRMLVDRDWGPSCTDSDEKAGSKTGFPPSTWTASSRSTKFDYRAASWCWSGKDLRGSLASILNRYGNWCVMHKPLQVDAKLCSELTLLFCIQSVEKGLWKKYEGLGNEKRIVKVILQRTAWNCTFRV